MKKIILLLFVLLFAGALQAQDSIPLKKWQKKKIEAGWTVSAFFPPPVYGEGIVDHKSKLSFGGDYFMNWHFTRYIGITWGVGYFAFKKSFDIILNDYHNNSDTATFSFKPDATFLRFPINILWDINPAAKVRCFINAGIAPFWRHAIYNWDSGSKDFVPPSKLVSWQVTCSYNINLGIKVPLYKSLAYIALLSYENAFVPLRVTGYAGSNIHTKNGFLSLRMGLCL
jgi:hypothetical protein